MEISITTIKDVKVAGLVGDIDANTASSVTKEVLPLAEPGSKIILDMTKVPYMSSAGLRMLLSLYRQTMAKEGQLLLVGLTEEIIDTMTVTGFLDFFATSATLEKGIEALASK
ncbi:anti-sigma factor antagonist [Anabaena cylindrica FACHB-243]|uniref:Anti-sigma factor antagonist n=1 Tax=Anabaena cylindrica (strain ATCC 27899 / PCC 7122) TaxID=272123 RepID=K9ZEY5_ANACC|nr:MULTISPECIES: anti-sigma factor antagonist [Anabaena]AFZ57768.1 anti-anti-sigma factor [Anabaena cylindrica PCC 7122]MBD2419322.1 anti-sigma factor antagonist [Anabaena cylindrica FACHB-243]MBY5282172.1 anti-sigma factor antagonist [Anabaena sp. CCAP 1446/1C]MBY5307944.1 anti-sigma factor antagonist [Anabaena sp. CCAP 1446/1C]MCM2409138.1 anti-sigma factor antagonist [Anabaena sp. CCAP 1446/1C]